MATVRSMDLVRDSVGLFGNVVEWRSVSFVRRDPRNVRSRSYRGLAWRGRFCRGMSGNPEEVNWPTVFHHPSEGEARPS